MAEPKPRANVGDRFGALVVTKNKNGMRGYGGGCSVTDCMITFTCECGKEMDSWYDGDLPRQENKWPQDCGCGAGQSAQQFMSAPIGRGPGRPPIDFEKKRVLQSVTLSLGCIARISTYAQASNISMSRAVERCIDGYLDSLQRKRASFSDTVGVE